MGYYVNPTGTTKEAFLVKNGELVDLKSLQFEAIPKGKLPVILVGNGDFNAAGIAYSAAELDAFRGPQDTRLKRAYLVSVADLMTATNSDFHSLAGKLGLA